MGYRMIFPYMYRMCNDQIRVINISITSSFYHFFVLGTSKIVSSSYLEIYNKLVLTVVILQCFRTLELFFLSIVILCLLTNLSLFILPVLSSSSFPASSNCILLSTSLSSQFLESLVVAGLRRTDPQAFGVAHEGFAAEGGKVAGGDVGPQTGQSLGLWVGAHGSFITGVGGLAIISEPWVAWSSGSLVVGMQWLCCWSRWGG